MVASDSGSPLQPPQAQPGILPRQLSPGYCCSQEWRYLGEIVTTSFNRGFKRCASRSTLHPFMNALEKDRIGDLRRRLQTD
ncbi:hypothetical protein Tco_0834943 [Tanacetum coccineum]